MVTKEELGYNLLIQPCSVAAVYSSSVNAPAKRMKTVSQRVVSVLSWSATSYQFSTEDER